jgi:hypothetical protein
MKSGILSHNGDYSTPSYDKDNVNWYVDKVADQITILTLSKQDWEKFRGTPGK